MDYKVSKGDSLWSIVKDNYKCKNNREIANQVNKIVKKNNIKNPDCIFDGSTIKLPETKNFISKETEKTKKVDAEKHKKVNDKVDKSTEKVNEFDKWSGTYNEDLESVEDFSVFDKYNESTYAKDLKDFSQNVINKYDADKDGNLNFDEFVSMSTNGEGIPEDQRTELRNMYGTLFHDLNFDNDEGHINAGEFASMLKAADTDINTLECDGKINYSLYQTLPILNPELGENTDKGLFNFWHNQQKNFYKENYEQ